MSEDGVQPDPGGRRGKSASAFRTITEVASELDLPQHVLRFWETKFPQIRPMKRGGGRRYYRPEDIDFLRHIRKLLHEDGYTIKGVQKLLRQYGTKAVETASALVTPPPPSPPPPSTAPRLPDPPSESLPPSTFGGGLPRGELLVVIDELQELKDLLGRLNG